MNQKFKRTDCGRHVIFKSTNSAALDVETFKYQRFTPSGYKDMGIQKLYVLLFLLKTIANKGNQLFSYFKL